MPARVKARAVIWVGDQVVVHLTKRRGHTHVTFPGGRVNDRESVSDALVREVFEEVGLEIEVGDLLLAAEILSGARRQDVELVFEATTAGPVDGPDVHLVDPQQPDLEVLPPILGVLAELRRDGSRPRWLGNLYRARSEYP